MHIRLKSHFTPCDLCDCDLCCLEDWRLASSSFLVESSRWVDCICSITHNCSLTSYIYLQLLPPTCPVFFIVLITNIPSERCAAVTWGSRHTNQSFITNNPVIVGADQNFQVSMKGTLHLIISFCTLWPKLIFKWGQSCQEQEEEEQKQTTSAANKNLFLLSIS